MSSFMVRWLKLSLVIVVGCGFLAMMIYALLNRDEISSSQVEPPLISPPSEPLKRRPDQPGGMQIPNRDKLVFDLLDSSNTTLGETGVASGKAVTVTEVTGMVVADVSDSVAAVEAVGMDVETASPTQPIAAVAPVKAAVVPVVVSAAQVVKPVVAVAPKVEEKPAVVQKVIEKPVEKIAEKAPEKVAEVKPVAGGKWGVQVAAVNSTADGNAMVSKLVKDFPALKSLSPKVSAVPNAKKFRVQFLGLKDRDAAAGVCAKLAGKQPCFPVGN